MSITANTWLPDRPESAGTIPSDPTDQSGDDARYDDGLGSTADRDPFGDF